MKKLDRKEMMCRLKSACPGIWLRFGEEFSDETDGAIWTTAERSEVVHRATGLVPFDYYNQTDRYQFGVLKTIWALLEAHGWIAEWHDPGTVLIYSPD